MMISSPLLAWKYSLHFQINLKCNSDTPHIPCSPDSSLVPLAHIPETSLQYLSFPVWLCLALDIHLWSHFYFLLFCFCESAHCVSLFSILGIFIIFCNNDGVFILSAAHYCSVWHVAEQLCSYFCVSKENWFLQTSICNHKSSTIPRASLM